MRFQPSILRLVCTNTSIDECLVFEILRFIPVAACFCSDMHLSTIGNPTFSLRIASLYCVVGDSLLSHFMFTFLNERVDADTFLLSSREQ